METVVKISGNFIVITDAEDIRRYNKSKDLEGIVAGYCRWLSYKSGQDKKPTFEQIANKWHDICNEHGTGCL